MEGASGDDWISGAQSMRAYLRAALISDLIAAHLRRLGHSARAYSMMSDELNHVPLLLLAGIGELSRIGEVVLNPFVGPRFKSRRDHRPPARAGSPDRLRPPGLLLEVQQVCARVPRRRDPLRRQDDVQRLRDVEADVHRCTSIA